ncbi:MAG: hypothetical protein Q8O89_03860 [Nanoarchaeota archaeon]|nr:hypothetical protein [Nanoarchaeota archaeon]
MKLNILFSEKKNGLCVNFKNRNYQVIFSPNHWQELSKDQRNFFMDNYAFLKSVHFPLMFSEKEINLNTAEPLLKSQFIRMQLMDIPSLAYSEDKSPEDKADLIRNANYKFKDTKIKRMKFSGFDDPNSSIISFSFGKDSLITLGLAKELGLKTNLFMSEEKGAPIEMNYKNKLSTNFKKEFGLEIEKVFNDAMLLHDFDYFKIKSKNQYLLSHLITEYVMLAMPSAHYHNSKYIFLGNERSCNYYVLDKFGNRCYPAFDQSSEWNAEMNTFLAKFSKLKVASLIEPVGDLAILKILYKRYPELAKYQYSCFPDESKKVANARWCGHCTKCARLYIMLTALGIDPKVVGFTNNMLNGEARYYSIFDEQKNESKDNSNKNQNKRMLYEEIGVGRNEQLFSFYLAYKNGATGKLINKFKEKYLDFAKEKEEEWRTEFFGIHESKMQVSKKLKTKIYSIYKEELSD